jgi:VIT1/CCC1 family predicted Fe2+/Mn2+ transporter
MPKQTKRESAAYLRNFIFGVEDSLVSTVGLISGIAIADVGRKTVFLTGMILIVVEALSMGVGSVLSESSAEEFVFKNGRSMRIPLAGGVIMLFSYFLAGFVPLTPYLIFDTDQAFYISIIASLISLFLLGSVSARYFHVNILKSGLRMLILGGIAITAGVIVGSLLK